MSDDEFHEKWCDEHDRVSRAMHMALREVGYETRLFKAICPHSDRIHVDLTGTPSDKAALRAAMLVMPSEMFADWLEVNGIGVPA